MLLCTPLFSRAQSNQIVVESFTSNPNEQTAVTHKKIDPVSHKPCALVIFQNVEVGDYRFKVSGYSEREDKTSEGKKEIWLYVAPNTKTITISNSEVDAQPLPYNTGQPLKSGRTYFARVGNVYKRSNEKQYLILNLTPANASVEVNDVPWEVNGGTVQQSVKMGRYKIRAKAPEYHDWVDEIEVSDPTKATTVNIALKPAFGFLTVDGADVATDASVFVDAVKIGNGTLTRHKLASGSHTLKITRPLYKVYERPFTVTDEQVVTVTPELEADFAVTTLTVPNNAEIWIDGEKKGSGTWRGPLQVGEYIVETRLASHEPQRMQINVTDANTAHDFTLKPPKPIYGSIDVKCSKIGAHILLDGKDVGTAPYLINEVLIGPHTVKITLPGYADFSTTVAVVKGHTVTVNGILDQTAKLELEVKCGSSSSPDLTVNGIQRTNPFIYTGKIGETVRIAAEAYHCKSYNQTITLTRATQKKEIYLPYRTVYYAPTGVYIDCGVSLIGIGGLNANIGFYFGTSGVNFEAEYIQGLFSPVENVYWSRLNGNGEGGEVIDYQATAFGGKLGYGITLGRRFNLTPQIGMRYARLRTGVGDEQFGGMYSYGYSSMFGTYAISGTAALRLDMRTAKHFSFYIVPEYSFIMKQGNICRELINNDTGVGRLVSGFNLRVGFTLRFALGWDNTWDRNW